MRDHVAPGGTVKIDMGSSRPATRRRHRPLALGVTAAIAVGMVTAISAPAGARTHAAPKHGGSAVFALEAETSSGYCLPDATLAASGIQVVNAIYDTLVALNTKGEAVPYLAKSIEPNADYTKWTFTLRPGIKFQNGEPLDAAALKLNLDTYRGVNPNIKPRLNVFVFQDVQSVDITGPLAVTVSLKRPWVAFPSYFVGRFGIVAPAQLVDRETCATHPIGTGPFTFVEWRVNDYLKVERNPDYWRKGLPYLDEITFKPVPEASQRVNGLTSGEFDLATTSDSISIIDLKQQAKDGDLQVIASDKGAETAYLMLNSAEAPFDDPVAREAVALAGDARQVNRIRNRGLNTIATGPFPPDNAAYVPEIARRPNVKRATRLANQYEAKTGQALSFEYLTSPTPELVAIAQLFKEQESRAGIDVSIRTVDQSTLINEALAGNFQSAAWRNHPGGDPDTQYVWWYSTSPVNFGKFKDAEIDRLLDEGRSEPDPAKRTEIYKDISRRFAKQLYNLWSWYTYWAIGYQNDVRGVSGPPLPDGGGKPFALFGGIIPTAGLWKT
jgi:peptide/nickel transport system substrate-binding protein